MKKIYLDNQATTALDPRVLDAMLPYFSEKFGNPASQSHQFGWEAAEAVEIAREQIATLIGSSPREIVFTSGATESNNLAIKGAVFMYREQGNHIITCKTEHKSVLDPCAALRHEGFEITYLPVNENGLINLEKLAGAIKKSTILVSLMHANNEIGVIQPIAEIGRLCRENKILFHVDGAQAAGKIPVNVTKTNISLFSISAHKMYGPNGVGALFVRRKDPRVQLKAQIEGGGHERGIRSGTLPVPLIVGFGKACEIALSEMETESSRLKILRDKLADGIISQLTDVKVNGDVVNRLPNNLNLSFCNIEGDSLLRGMPNIAVSSGSACTSSISDPSHVLMGIGLTKNLARSSLRFSLGRFTTEMEIDETIQAVVKAVKRLRKLSQRWS